MNVKELKKLVPSWVNNQVTDAAILDAIMALPDDPQAEHEDLVSLAYKYHQVGGAYGSGLASAVIERFGKKEPRKVVAKSVLMLGDLVYDDEMSEVQACEYISKRPGEGFWIGTLTVTEQEVGK